MQNNNINMQINNINLLNKINNTTNNKKYILRIT